MLLTFLIYKNTPVFQQKWLNQCIQTQFVNIWETYAQTVENASVFIHILTGFDALLIKMSKKQSTFNGSLFNLIYLYTATII